MVFLTDMYQLGSAVFSISLYEVNFQLQLVLDYWGVGPMGCGNSGTTPPVLKLFPRKLVQ